MTLVEIENLPHDELKAKRLELIDAAAKGDVKELATRFVDARTDAKLRDIRMGEQGETITKHEATIATLNNVVKEKSDLVTKREGEIRAVENQLVAEQNVSRSLREAAEESDRQHQAAISQLRAELQQMAGQLEAANRLAKDRRVALAGVMNVISPVLAAE